MQYRENLSISGEVKDLAIAALVLGIAFSMFLVGGLAGALHYPSVFLYFFPIAIIAILFTFVLHELMHKFVAQHFGAVAAFKASITGLVITLIPSMLGFLIGIPGATVIYTSSFTREEEGYVSLAGPLTNLAVFIVAASAGVAMYGSFFQNVATSFMNPTRLTYLHNIINITLFISIVLALFNMLPIYPLDGSKVMRWNKKVYMASIATIFILMLLVVPFTSLIISLAIMFFIAYLFSASTTLFF
jgi:Zn-dependent protease